MKFKKILIIILSLSLFSKSAMAGDFMKSGETLSEDSYVFNVEEATDLMNRLYQLEQENEKQKKILEQYKLLDDVQAQEGINYKSLLDTKELQIEEYQKLRTLELDRIHKLERHLNSSRFENWGFLALGVGLTVGSIILADKIDDNLEKSVSNTPTVGMTVRF